jgi:hypothetical protein
LSEIRKIAAILVSDVVGYSRLTGADEDQILARLRTLRSDLIDPLIPSAPKSRVPGERQCSRDIVMLAEPPSGRQTSTRFGSISTMLVTLLGLIAIRWPPSCENIG